jgi:outer membrane protein W
MTLRGGMNSAAAKKKAHCMQLKLIAAAAALAIAATPVLAQEVRGKRAGDVVLGAGLIGVLPSRAGARPSAERRRRATASRRNSTCPTS